MSLEQLDLDIKEAERCLEVIEAYLPNPWYESEYIRLSSWLDDALHRRDEILKEIEEESGLKVTPREVVLERRPYVEEKWRSGFTGARGFVEQAYRAALVVRDDVGRLLTWKWKR